MKDIHIKRVIEVCKACQDWFAIEPDDNNIIRLVNPGDDCEYCTDLTGRPAYVPGK